MSCRVSPRRILQPQIRLLGTYRRATELVDGAADDIVATLGSATDLSEKAVAAWPAGWS